MADYNPTVCYNNLTGSGAHPCPNMEAIGSVSYHCMDAQESGAIHEFCSKNNIYVPFHWFELYNTKLCGENEYHDTPGDNPSKCQPHVFASYNDAFKWQNAQPNPSDWSSRPCDCCCSCYAYGTPIAVPGGYKAIEKIAQGEDVLAGSLTVQDGNISISWSNKEVNFSDGTPPQPQGLPHYPNMVYINYDDGKKLIVTLDEIFLLNTGHIKRAGTLTIHDELVSPDGNPVKINSVMLAEYSGGIHHISTDTKFSGSVDDHLLNSNGVISGDYILQIYASKLSDLLVDGPTIGSKEYHQDNSFHAVAPHAFVHARKNVDKTLPANIRLYSGQTSYIPEVVNEFFTDAQTIDILANPNIRKYPFSYKGGLFNIQYMFKVYNTFYPDIRFYVDWENTSPNAYAFWEYGEKHVVVSGELARLGGFLWQGMAVVLAQSIATFFSPTGQDTKELLPKAKADYYGVGLMMRVVWPLDYFNIAKEGLKQINYLFDAIPAEDSKGDPQNPLEDPSLECRKMTMQSGFYGGELPKCAGGPDPKPEKLMVAYAQPGPDLNKATIVFTKAVDKTSGEIATNYIFKPEVKVSDVKIDVVDQKKVVITGEFQASTDYSVTVFNVTAADGSAIDTSNNFAFFTTGAN